MKTSPLSAPSWDVRWKVPTLPAPAEDHFRRWHHPGRCPGGDQQHPPPLGHLATAVRIAPGSALWTARAGPIPHQNSTPLCPRTRAARRFPLPAPGDAAASVGAPGASQPNAGLIPRRLCAMPDCQLTELGKCAWPRKPVAGFGKRALPGKICRSVCHFQGHIIIESHITGQAYFIIY